MGKIYATCGHEIPSAMGYAHCIKDYNKMGNRVCSYVTLCKKCLKRYEQAGLLIDKDKEEQKRLWLKEGI